MDVITSQNLKDAKIITDAFRACAAKNHSKNNSTIVVDICHKNGLMYCEFLRHNPCGSSYKVRVFKKGEEFVVDGFYLKEVEPDFHSASNSTKHEYFKSKSETFNDLTKACEFAISYLVD